ncbi:MAG: Gfo/Idh/MocA family oxidoreductase [Candidatus Scalindua sp.]|nr:Gfo/Idh/MocA family oxidoreductase [Candidatus Scalindua sp.]
MKIINWGIIATGHIASRFAREFPSVKNARLYAVGSRKLSRARSFALKYNIPKYYGSYQSLVNDIDIDAVYVATPHNLHRDNTISALKAGKSVLCEKPFAINALEALDMVTLARKKNLFLMEAMWARFNPALVKLQQILGKRLIGEVLHLRADFGFFAKYNPVHRLFNPYLGGGALLDVGVYPLSLASMIFGNPINIKSAAAFGKTGVDEQNSILLEYQKNKIAQLSSAIILDTDREAHIAGTKGSIKLDASWHRSLKVTVMIRDKNDIIYEFDEKHNGLHHEVLHMMNCIRSGKKESTIMSLDESLSIMKTMDTIRAQWNLTYPMEK